MQHFVADAISFLHYHWQASAFSRFQRVERLALAHDSRGISNARECQRRRNFAITAKNPARIGGIGDPLASLGGLSAQIKSVFAGSAISLVSIFLIASNSIPTTC